MKLNREKVIAELEALKANLEADNVKCQSEIDTIFPESKYRENLAEWNHRMILATAALKKALQAKKTTVDDLYRLATNVGYVSRDEPNKISRECLALENKIKSNKNNLNYIVQELRLLNLSSETSVTIGNRNNVGWLLGLNGIY